MSKASQVAAICDANVLIDYVHADEEIIRELVAYWGTVNVPDRVLFEVKQLPLARAEELGLKVIETPLTLPPGAGLSGPDRACLHYVITEGWTCITKARALDIAVRINADNPEITDKILADFEEKLSKIHTE